jgi:hypothetical protein
MTELEITGIQFPLDETKKIQELLKPLGYQVHLSLLWTLIIFWSN